MIWSAPLLITADLATRDIDASAEFHNSMVAGRLRTNGGVVMPDCPAYVIRRMGPHPARVYSGHIRFKRLLPYSNPMPSARRFVPGRFLRPHLVTPAVGERAIAPV